MLEMSQAMPARHLLSLVSARTNVSQLQMRLQVVACGWSRDEDACIGCLPELRQQSVRMPHRERRRTVNQYRVQLRVAYSIHERTIRARDAKDAIAKMRAHVQRDGWSVEDCGDAYAENLHDPHDTAGRSLFPLYI